jgi:hypothetical protein
VHRGERACELGELWHADRGRTRGGVAYALVLVRIVTCPGLHLPWPVDKTSSHPLKLPLSCGGALKWGLSHSPNPRQILGFVVLNLQVSMPSSDML